MASEQIMNEAIAKAVAEATRAAIQAMVVATGKRNAKHGRTQTRQPCHETTNVQLGGRRQV